MPVGRPGHILGAEARGVCSVICHHLFLQHSPSHRGLKEKEVQLPQGLVQGRQIPAMHRRKAPGTLWPLKITACQGEGSAGCDTLGHDPSQRNKASFRESCCWVISS